MKQFFNSEILFVFLMLAAFPLLADNKSFGNIKLVIDSSDSLALNVQTALLYRNVTLDYDSTLLVQNREGVNIKYYPQFGKGKQNVLRILAGEILGEKPRFYDIFFILGDSIPDSVNWKETNSKILMVPNGYVTANKAVSEDINGKINFDRDKKGNIIAGSLNLNFNIQLFESYDILNQVIMSGAFELAVGTYRELALSKSESDVNKKKRGRQSLYLGIVFTVFLIAIFGLR